MTEIRLADAEQAKKTGGMVALFPRKDFLETYGVPHGEPLEDLHVTLAYFGEDVSGQSPLEIQQVLDDLVGQFPQMECRVFAQALFNPDGANDREPCAVYLIGDSDDLPAFRSAMMEDFNDRQIEMPHQHNPYIPHMTAGYSIPITDLADPGEIVFDRVQLEWGSETYVFPLS